MLMVPAAPSFPATEPIELYVVNYPLKYFAERIGGGRVNVMFPAPKNVDPAYWSPDVATVGAYQKADMILLNGAGYAKWVQKVSLPRSKTVNTTKKLKHRYITIKGAVTHSHGPGGEHAHEDTAFTTWLDFDLAARQTESILRALVRRMPGGKKGFERNHSALLNDLAAMDADVRSMVETNPSSPLLASHPVYGYFARRYGLNLKSVHWEPDIFPAAEQWIECIHLLKRHPARWMIWEGPSGAETVSKLERIGVKSLVFRPCGNVPEEGDFLQVMRRNIENLRKAFP